MDMAHMEEEEGLEVVSVKVVVLVEVLEQAVVVVVVVAEEVVMVEVMEEAVDLEEVWVEEAVDLEEVWAEEEDLKVWAEEEEEDLKGSEEVVEDIDEEVVLVDLVVIDGNSELSNKLLSHLAEAGATCGFLLKNHMFSVFDIYLMIYCHFNFINN
ncbi:uncharacterized protein LOC143232110 isoform X1 [Tachypleus tridentatus]|uniref:uncharacterized protein LOC143232110 isoform X1 n=1 Tax=Tachypleus tridentatus TaxID=6853 RepID=UPI003FCF14E6